MKDYVIDEERDSATLRNLSDRCHRICPHVFVHDDEDAGDGGGGGDGGEWDDDCLIDALIGAQENVLLASLLADVSTFVTDVSGH